MWKPGRPLPHPRLVAVVAQDQRPPPRGVGSRPAGGRWAGLLGAPQPTGSLCLGRTSQLPSPPCTPGHPLAGTSCPQAQAQLTNGHGNWGALPLLPGGALGARGAGRSLCNLRSYLGSPRSDGPLPGAPQSPSGDPAPLPRPSPLHLSLCLRVFSFMEGVCSLSHPKREVT